MSAQGNWNEAEFASLFKAHYRQILSIARRVVGSNAEAEEIAAEAFWRLYRAGPQTASQGSVHGWLCCTATRAAIDTLRARKRRREEEIPLSLDPEDQTDGPLGTMVRREQIEEVRNILARLDVEKAQILLLRHTGLSYAEIAEAMGVRPGSVGTMLARAEDAFCRLYRVQGCENESTRHLVAAKEQR